MKRNFPLSLGELLTKKPCNPSNEITSFSEISGRLGFCLKRYYDGTTYNTDTGNTNAVNVYRAKCVDDLARA